MVFKSGLLGRLDRWVRAFGSVVIRVRSEMIYWTGRADGFLFLSGFCKSCAGLIERLCFWGVAVERFRVMLVMPGRNKGSVL